MITAALYLAMGLAFVAILAWVGILALCLAIPVMMIATACGEITRFLFPDKGVKP